MKFTCNTKDLVNAVQIATRVMSPRSPMEILEGVLLDADENGLTVTASDGVMTSVTRISADIETDGTVLMPGKLLGEVLRKFPEGTLSASLSQQFVLTLKSAGSRTNIAGRSGAEYPMPNEDGFSLSTELPQPLLKDMINQVSFAVPLEDQRVVLTGGYLNMENGSMDLVGLDGFRMAIRSALSGDTDKRIKAIIPARSLEELARLMGDDENSRVKLSFGKNRMLAENGTTRLYTGLIEGEYIDYHRVIPKSFNVTVSVDRAQFCSCVERTALMARESRNNLVRFDVSEGRLVMTSSGERGDVREEMDAEVSGGELAISFNVRYLTEIIRVIGGERILIKLGTSVTPCVICPEQGSDFTFLVLPVRTNA